MALFAAFCGFAPDLDIIGEPLGIPQHSMLGHRGLMHSLPFAVAFGCAIAWLGFRHLDRRQRLQLSVLFALATATHGFFDALSSYFWSGPAFFAPFTSQRYRFAWTPLRDPPGVLLATSLQEFWVIWIPMGLLALLGWYRRRARPPRSVPTGGVDLTAIRRRLFRVE